MCRRILWRLLLCLLLFASTLQCLDAAVILARPRQHSPIKKSIQAPARLSSSPGAVTPAPAPRPEAFLPGQFVGVRVKSYEKGSKVDTIHPGVVVDALPNKQYRVSMISNRLPGNLPQKPAKTYQNVIEGNISLSPIVTAWGKMKIWRHSGTGPSASVLSADMLTKLKADISTAAGSGGSSST